MKLICFKFIGMKKYDDIMKQNTELLNITESSLLVNRTLRISKRNLKIEKIMSN